MPPTMQAPGIDKLSLNDRIALLEELEVSVARELEDESLTAAQIAELDRRRQDSIEHPERGVPWEVVKADLLAKIQGLKP